MKRNVLIAALCAALCAVALVLAMGCSADIEPTEPDLRDFNKQFAVERTDNKGATILSDFADAFLDNWNIPSPVAPATTSVFDLDVDFMNNDLIDGDYSIDLFSETTGFAAALQGIVKFYRYTDAGTYTATAITPGAVAELSYSVVEWAGYRARLRFTIDPKTVSNKVEMRIDPANFTHHNGQKVDYNNDGKFDQYDTYIKQISLLNVEDDTSDYVMTNYQFGLVSGSFANGTNATGTEATWTIGINSVDSTDYESKLNEVYKLQEFTAANGWANSSTGKYIPADKKFTFSVALSETTRVFRIIVADYNTVRTSGWTGPNIFGVAQQFTGTWPSIATANYVVSSARSVRKTVDVTNPVEAVSGNPFSIDHYAYDHNERNVMFEVLIDLSSVGDLGLPDPKAALESGTLRIGYSSTGSLGNWNSIVFFPKSDVTITALAVRLDGDPVTADDAADLWRVTLPPAYKANGLEKYFFFTPDFVSNGNKVTAPADPQKKYFGNYANTYAIADEGGTKRAFFGTFSLGTDF